MTPVQHGGRRGGRRTTTASSSMFRTSVLSTGSSGNAIITSRPEEEEYSSFEGFSTTTTHASQDNNMMVVPASSLVVSDGTTTAPPQHNNNDDDDDPFSTKRSSISTLQEEQQQQHICCPRGHIMEKANSEDPIIGTCDYCNIPLDDNIRGDGDDTVKSSSTLVCFRCGGFAICNQCVNKYNQSDLAKSARYYTAGMEFFKSGNYKQAISEFQTSLDMLQLEVARSNGSILEIHHCAFNAEMLAKAQYLSAASADNNIDNNNDNEIDTALQTCALAISYYWSRANGGPWQKHLRRAQQLAIDMSNLWIQKQQQQLKQQTLFLHSSNHHQHDSDLDLLGVSVHHHLQLETATTYSSIGSALQMKGDYNGAMKHFEKGLTIAESVCGRDHPAAAKIHNSMGSLTMMMTSNDDAGGGDYDIALEHYYKCLAIREAVLGRDHPDTAGTRRDIGIALGKKGDYSGAMELYKRCLGVFRSVFGEDHPTTKSCFDDIVLLEKALKSQRVAG